MVLLLLSRFSHVRLCATQWMAAHQVPPSLRFSRQEHWSGLPFPSPMHESEKWKGSHSVVSDSSQLHGLQPTRLLCPWDFPGKSTGVGCHCLLRSMVLALGLSYIAFITLRYVPSLPTMLRVLMISVYWVMANAFSASFEMIIWYLSFSLLLLYSTLLDLWMLIYFCIRGKRLPGMQETRVRSLGQEDPLEKEMATHSSTLVWRIPWREEPGRLQSMGLQRVGHDWAEWLHSLMILLMYCWFFWWIFC